MILGLTHRTDGTPIQQLAVAYKVSIGIPADGNSNFPKKSDHFHIRAKNPKGEWVDDGPFIDALQKEYSPEIPSTDGTSKVRAPLREFDIIFLSDNIDDIFRTELAWWATSEKKCSGDGAQAKRSRTALSPEKQKELKTDDRYIPWTPCGDACPDLQAGRCKPSGNLFFIFKDRPVMGSVASYTTTSYETVKRIHSSLLQIQSVTGGRLRGIPFKIVMRPGKTSYEDQGKRKSGSAFFVNIEFREADFRQLVPKLMEYSAEYVRSITSGQKALAEHIDDEALDTETITIDEGPEAAQAQAMTSEFQPQNRDGAASQTQTVDVDPDIDRQCNRLGLNPAHRDMLNHALKGDLSEILRWVNAFVAYVEQSKIPAVDIPRHYSELILQPQKVYDLAAKPAAPPDPPAPARRKRAANQPAPPQPAASAPAAPEPPKLTAPDEPAAEAPAGTWNF